MNFEKAVTKAEKLTGQKASVINNTATILYKGYRIEFFLNGTGPNATCYSTCRQDLHMDTQTDYFPQTFHDNITQCVKHIDRMVPDVPADEADAGSEMVQGASCPDCGKVGCEGDCPEPVAAPLLAIQLNEGADSRTHLEIVCLGENGSAESYNMERPTTVDEARLIIAEQKKPRGNPEYDNYWPQRNWAIRRVTTTIVTLEKDR